MYRRKYTNKRYILVHISTYDSKAKCRIAVVKGTKSTTNFLSGAIKVPYANIREAIAYLRTELGVCCPSHKFR